MSLSYQCPFCQDCLDDKSAAMLDIRSDGKRRCNTCEAKRAGRIEMAEEILGWVEQRFMTHNLMGTVGGDKLAEELHVVGYHIRQLLEAEEGGE